MKLGDVLRKERERKRLSISDVASTLGVTEPEYEALEAGNSPIEEWGPKLALIATRLKTPTSRFISKTGKAAQAERGTGQCGSFIKAHRERSEVSQEELAQALGVSVSEIASIENGESPLEEFAPLLLRFAELIKQPIFNLFYPCGLPFDRLDDYP